jgi:ABC-type lipoprotein export system ATPase subunit
VESDELILAVKCISKTQGKVNGGIRVLDQVSFALNEGETVAIMGPSGSGKTTLLQLCGLLDTVDRGEIEISGHTTSQLGENERTQLRKKYIGFVYQTHNLFPELTALENVMLPLWIRQGSRKEARKEAEKVLERFGLQSRGCHLPAELSGGERQRVAIARALVKRPRLLLADEPTGSLDDTTAEIVFDYLMQTLKETKASLLLVTHNQKFAIRTNRLLMLKNQQIVFAQDREF